MRIRLPFFIDDVKGNLLYRGSLYADENWRGQGNLFAENFLSAGLPPCHVVLKGIPGYFGISIEVFFQRFYFVECYRGGLRGPFID